MLRVSGRMGGMLARAAHRPPGRGCLAGRAGWGIIGPVIFGERVRLRRVEREDLPRLVEWMNDPAVREYLTLGYPMGRAHEEEWLEATLHQEPALQPFAIEARVSPPGTEPAEWVHIGTVGFHRVDWRNRSAELGIAIGRRDCWGKGYGTDTVRALCRWAFAELNLNRVQLKVDEDNARGIASYEKAGFRLEGRLRQDRYRGGRYLDTLVMGLLRDELK